jgi:hypothetical protein
MILYCHCAYARVVPPETKSAVLDGLAGRDVEFEAVPDLCEMAARGDPRLRELASGGPLRIAACYPRAVKWLFASAGVNLEGQETVILNMRTERAERVLERLLEAPGLADIEGPTGSVEAGHEGPPGSVEAGHEVPPGSVEVGHEVRPGNGGSGGSAQ